MSPTDQDGERINRIRRDLSKTLYASQRTLQSACLLSISDFNVKVRYPLRTSLDPFSNGYQCLPTIEGNISLEAGLLYERVVMLPTLRLVSKEC
jgi:hypothetical protein